MVDFTIAIFLQLGLLLLLGRLLPVRSQHNSQETWLSSLPSETDWDAARRMIEREYGASSRCGGADDLEE